MKHNAHRGEPANLELWRLPNFPLLVLGDPWKVMGNLAVWFFELIGLKGTKKVVVIHRFLVVDGF